MANRIPRQLARRLPPAKADQRGSRRLLPKPRETSTLCLSSTFFDSVEMSSLFTFWHNL
jgi:hypothetical protein